MKLVAMFLLCAAMVDGILCILSKTDSFGLAGIIQALVALSLIFLMDE